MEVLEIVREDSNKPTGVALSRAEVLAKSAWCRSTNVFVLNSQGDILCHQRSLQKERMPGMWCTHLGGHVSAGETYEVNAAKELEEEAGIIVPPHRLIPWRTTKLNKARLWVREFVTCLDVDIHQLNPQAGEVEAFAWKTVEAILHEASLDSSRWCAGTHDFFAEYQCLRAVLAAAGHLGVWETPMQEQLHVWHPPTLASK